MRQYTQGLVIKEAGTKNYTIKRWRGNYKNQDKVSVCKKSESARAGGPTPAAAWRGPVPGGGGPTPPA
jgi:hypothetical protein